MSTIQCFELSRVVKDVEAAFDATTGFLRAHSLPSAWSSKGRGWQELLSESEKKGRPAGFYATCDGLLILSYARSWSSADVRDFARSVYHHSLCPVFGQRVATTPDQERMREQVVPNTMKLARFVQASALWRTEPSVKRVASPVVRILKKRGAKKPGQWAASTAGGETSLAGTSEALLALAAWHGGSHVLVRQGLGYLVGIAKLEPKSPFEKSRRVVALWALSAFLTELPASKVKKLAAMLLSTVAGDSHLDVEPYREDFLLPSGGHDYYTYDTASLRATALLRFLQVRAVTSAEVRPLIPQAASVAAKVRLNGLYDPEGASGQFRFWRHHQAMRFLSVFREVAQADRFEKGAVMLVKPKVFPAKSYKVDPKLAVVLMPFKQKWSSDVYKVFCATLRSKGMKAWRSDKEHKDDVIVESIWEYINRAAFVIADCTGKNPNVFYELGLVHVLGKPVFICTQESAPVAFDIKAIRHFAYTVQPSGIKELKKHLAAFIESLE